MRKRKNTTKVISIILNILKLNQYTRIMMIQNGIASVKNYSNANIKPRKDKSNEPNKKQKPKTQNFDQNSNKFKYQQENTLEDVLGLIYNIEKAADKVDKYSYSKNANDFQETLNFQNNIWFHININ